MLKYSRRWREPIKENLGAGGLFFLKANGNGISLASNAFGNPTANYREYPNPRAVGGM